MISCDFESEVEDVTLRHFATEHVVRDRKKIDDITFLLFDSRGDFDVYKKARINGDTVKGDWEGRGWYGQFHESAPCGRGCCSREWIDLRSVRECLAKWQEQSDEIQSRIDAVNKLQPPVDAA